MNSNPHPGAVLPCRRPPVLVGNGCGFAVPSSTSDGLQPKSNGLQPSVCLQPIGHGGGLRGHSPCLSPLRRAQRHPGPAVLHRRSQPRLDALDALDQREGFPRKYGAKPGPGPEKNDGPGSELVFICFIENSPVEPLNPGFSPKVASLHSGCCIMLHHEGLHCVCSMKWIP